jgi:hypothetical protein
MWVSGYRGLIETTGGLFFWLIWRSARLAGGTPIQTTERA